MSLPDPSEYEGVTLLSTAKAAALLDISETSVRALVAAGELRTILILSKRRIPLPELRAYVDRQARRSRVAPVRARTG